MGCRVVQLWNETVHRGGLGLRLSYKAPTSGCKSSKKY